MMMIKTLLQRRRLLFVSLSLAILIGASLALALYSEAAHQVQIRRSAEVQAQILADSVSAALAFNDLDAIRQYTSALHANPDIEAVAVCDENGQLVAHYGTKAIATQLAQGDRAGAGGGMIRVRAAVVEKGLKLGTVYLSERSEGLATRIARYGGPAFLVVVGSLMLTIMAFDARKLGRSNAQLKRVMAEREQAEAALRQSQKMEAVGRLTGGIAHDFNNMLAVVIGNHDLFLRRNADGDPKSLRLITSAQDAARRAATLTQRLLAFSRRQPLDPRPADAGKSVTDMSDLLRRTLGESISIETVRAGGLWLAHVDVAQLETALVNLAVNARDAMPGGGKLTIETANAYLDRTYANTQEELIPGQYVLVAVTDTGTGMTPEVLAQVFEPFFTTKPVGQGTGLGLSQVHGFVKQTGGHITIYSEVGHGTTIKLYLPRSTEQVEAPAPESIKRALQGRRNLTILVVDDETGVREFAAEALIELGYDVLIAENADHAIAVLAQAGHVDILFTDIIMPGRNGRQLADMVKRTNPATKVLYMTGYTQNAIVHNGVLDAGTQLISKPFSINQLAEELDILERG